MNRNNAVVGADASLSTTSATLELPSERNSFLRGVKDGESRSSFSGENASSGSGAIPLGSVMGTARPTLAASANQTGSAGAGGASGRGSTSASGPVPAGGAGSRANTNRWGARPYVPTPPSAFAVAVSAIPAEQLLASSTAGATVARHNAFSVFGGSSPSFAAPQPLPISNTTFAANASFANARTFDSVLLLKHNATIGGAAAANASRAGAADDSVASALAGTGGGGGAECVPSGVDCYRVHLLLRVPPAGSSSSSTGSPEASASVSGASDGRKLQQVAQVRARWRQFLQLLQFVISVAPRFEPPPTPTGCSFPVERGQPFMPSSSFASTDAGAGSPVGGGAALASSPNAGGVLGADGVGDGAASSAAAADDAVVAPAQREARRRYMQDYLNAALAAANVSCLDELQAFVGYNVFVKNERAQFLAGMATGVTPAAASKHSSAVAASTDGRDSAARESTSAREKPASLMARSAPSEEPPENVQFGLSTHSTNSNSTVDSALPRRLRKSTASSHRPVADHTEGADATGRDAPSGRAHHRRKKQHRHHKRHEADATAAEDKGEPSDNHSASSSSGSSSNSGGSAAPTPSSRASSTVSDGAAARSRGTRDGRAHRTGRHRRHGHSPVDEAEEQRASDRGELSSPLSPHTGDGVRPSAPAAPASAIGADEKVMLEECFRMLDIAARGVVRLRETLLFWVCALPSAFARLMQLMQPPLEQRHGQDAVRHAGLAWGSPELVHAAMELIPAELLALPLFAAADAELDAQAFMRAVEDALRVLSAPESAAARSGEGASVAAWIDCFWVLQYCRLFTAAAVLLQGESAAVLRSRLTSIRERTYTEQLSRHRAAAAAAALAAPPHDSAAPLAALASSPFCAAQTRAGTYFLDESASVSLTLPAVARTLLSADNPPINGFDVFELFCFLFVLCEGGIRLVSLEEVLSWAGLRSYTRDLSFSLEGLASLLDCVSKAIPFSELLRCLSSGSHGGSRLERSASTESFTRLAAQPFASSDVAADAASSTAWRQQVAGHMNVLRLVSRCAVSADPLVLAAVQDKIVEHSWRVRGGFCEYCTTTREALQVLERQTDQLEADKRGVEEELAAAQARVADRDTALADLQAQLAKAQEELLSTLPFARKDDATANTAALTAPDGPRAEARQALARVTAHSVALTPRREGTALSARVCCAGPLSYDLVRDAAQAAGVRGAGGCPRVFSLDFFSCGAAGEHEPPTRSPLPRAAARGSCREHISLRDGDGRCVLSIVLDAAAGTITATGAVSARALASPLGGDSNGDSDAAAASDLSRHNSARGGVASAAAVEVAGHTRARSRSSGLREHNPFSLVDGAPSSPRRRIAGSESAEVDGAARSPYLHAVQSHHTTFASRAGSSAAVRHKNLLFPSFSRGVATPLSMPQEPWLVTVVTGGPPSPEALSEAASPVREARARDAYSFTDAQSSSPSTPGTALPQRCRGTAALCAQRWYRLRVAFAWDERTFQLSVCPLTPMDDVADEPAGAARSSSSSSSHAQGRTAYLPLTTNSGRQRKEAAAAVAAARARQVAVAAPVLDFTAHMLDGARGAVGVATVDLYPRRSLLFAYCNATAMYATE